MRHYILFLDAIIQLPEIVSLHHENYTLWVSEYYFDWNFAESQHTPSITLNACLTLAEQKGYIKRYSGQPFPKAFYSFSPYESSRWYDRTSMVLRFKKELQKQYPQDEIILVTEDRKDKGGYLHVKKLADQLKADDAIQDPDILLLAREIKSENWVLSISILLIGGVVLFVPAIFFTAVAYIRENKWLNVIVVVGIIFLLRSLFVLRRKKRIQYGIIEFFVGCVMIGKSLNSFLSESKTLSTIDYLAVLSGIYVVIRGLDNIETGLKAGNITYHLRWWNKLF